MHVFFEAYWKQSFYLLLAYSYFVVFVIRSYVDPVVPIVFAGSFLPYLFPPD